MTCPVHRGVSWYNSYTGDCAPCFVCSPSPAVFTYDAARFPIEPGPGCGIWVQDMIEAGQWAPGAGRQGNGR